MSGAVRSRTSQLRLAILNFAFPNWGDDANKNMRIIDGAFSAIGISVSGVWEQETSYTAGAIVIDTVTNELFRAAITHISSTAETFLEERELSPGLWVSFTSDVVPVGEWQAATTYFRNNVVYEGFRWAIANRQFVSAETFQEDLDAGNFGLIADTSEGVAAAQLAQSEALSSAEAAFDSAAAASVSAVAAAGSATLAEGYMNTALSTFEDLDGGTSGQVLVKQSGTNFDFTWADLAGGGDMLRVTYDPNSLGLNVYDMDSMIESATKKIFTSTERIKLTSIEANADVTDAANVGPIINAFGAKTPIDADALVFTDSAAPTAPKRANFANFKAFLKTYFDTLYAAIGNSIVAGNGLSGGGTLAASRTLTLGTPGTITGTSTNSVSTVSHTHDLTLTAANINSFLGYTAASTAVSIVAGTGLSGGGAISASRTLNVVFAEIGDMAVGTVGTYSFLTDSNTSTAIGNTRAGSSLRYSNAGGSVSSAPAGTWRCMGVSAPGGNIEKTTVWLRVA